MIASEDDSASGGVPRARPGCSTGSTAFAGLIRIFDRSSGGGGAAAPSRTETNMATVSSALRAAAAISSS
ncbi:MAG: hypothetical protein KDE06_13355, partial [Rhodobacteraceae bacterium]|nr:hypothetical protein [Paracoccaceae bacterium]